MKWCEHIKWDAYLEEWTTENPWANSHSGRIVSNWKVCPVCETPRPKKKSLEDKFKEALSGTIVPTHPDLVGRQTMIINEVLFSALDKLAQLAKDHYESKE